MSETETVPERVAAIVDVWGSRAFDRCECGGDDVRVSVDIREGSDEYVHVTTLCRICGETLEHADLSDDPLGKRVLTDDSEAEN